MSSLKGDNGRNVVWHKRRINRKDWEKKNKHKAMVLWLTGLPSSGKSTIANRLSEQLFSQGIYSYVLDGDNVRHGLNKDLGFSPEDRTENIRRIGEVCKLFLEAGIIVVNAFISPYKKDRNFVKDLVAKENFIEIYVDCSLEECENRDPKKLYEKARKGVIREFTGISAPYEKPENPEITLNTEQCSVEDCVSGIINYLQENQYIEFRK